MTEERLQKILARAGLGSRREAEALIEQGRVKVNGVTATLGMKADPERDQITVDGHPIPKPASQFTYVILNKPQGVLSDHALHERRRTVYDLVPFPGHLFVVGRLDYESEGLILLTNDGELANRLTHPRYGKEKEYRVLVARRPDEKQLEAWRHGVVLPDGRRAAPAEVSVEGVVREGAWLRVVMYEGRKREIREIARTIGLPVRRLVRTRIGPIQLGNLKPGEWRHLTQDEVERLRTYAMSESPRSDTKRTRRARAL
ncbi:pseudouridine synthase [uncultured Thermanaerothrix sp.]|uniref:pseudouridine synthase n=1 Tax=uncultured Thermanaerothrix sp. TaxID=1195149 RepID=UPI00261C7CC0|nr:pseudouridine synthase [uncultured Thermanaerothrix sp.]